MTGITWPKARKDRSGQLLGTDPDRLQLTGVFFDSLSVVV